MKAWGITDTGLVRKENQDAYSIWHAGGITAAVVCDGMGGAAGGQVASTVAVETYQHQLTLALHSGQDPRQLTQAMLYAVSLANAAIRERAHAQPELSKMGTTLVSAVCTDKELVVANVGDSRAYYINGDGITQISRDHSVVENMVETGEITRLEARHHPSRNLITRALGPDEAPQADTFVHPWQGGDFVLLCSDGLVNTVTEQEILFEVIHSKDLDHCLARLLEIAKDNGAPDNVTAALIMNEEKEVT